MNTVQQRLIKSDVNYGPIGPNTIRTASQIGNASGPADFGTGTATSQTLRVVLAPGSVVGIFPVSKGVYTYDEIPAALTNTLVPVVSHISLVDIFLKRISGSGDADAEFILKVDNMIVAKRRNNWTERNVDFDFGENGLPVLAGKVVSLSVINRGPSARAFNGTIYNEEV
jgi:hypothetical protein